jgi:hypothetical protein
MIYLVIALVAFGALLLAVLIETRSSIHMTWVIPLCLGLFTGTYLWAKSMFGYPTDAVEAEKQFVMLNYYIPPTEDKIFVWVIMQEETVPKAFEFPYDKEEHEALQQVGARMEEGARFVGAFREPLDGEDEKGEVSQSEGSGLGTLLSSGGMMSFRELSAKHFLPSKNDFYGTDSQ